jgi:hypothetical protein
MASSFSTKRRLMIGSLLFLAAFTIPICVFEVRSEPLECAGDICTAGSSGDLLIPLGITQTITKMTRFGPSGRSEERGIYVRHGIPGPVAIVLGLFAPIIMLIAALSRAISKLGGK